MNDPEIGVFDSNIFVDLMRTLYKKNHEGWCTQLQFRVFLQYFTEAPIKFNPFPVKSYDTIKTC